LSTISPVGRAGRARARTGRRVRRGGGGRRRDRRRPGVQAPL